MHKGFIVIEDMPFTRATFVDHLLKQAAGSQIISVDVSPKTELWNQIPDDLSGYTVFLDHNLGDNWPKGSELVSQLIAKGARVICISESTTFKELPPEDTFELKSYLNLPADSSSCSAPKFADFFKERIAATAA